MTRCYSGPHPEGSEEFGWSDHLSLLSLSPPSGHLCPWELFPVGGLARTERKGKSWCEPLLSDHVEGDLQVCGSGLGPQLPPLGHKPGPQTVRYLSPPLHGHGRRENL